MASFDLHKASSYASSHNDVPFLQYFASTTPESESRNTRLKLALLLQGSSLYDAEKVLDRIRKQEKILRLEMAILFGKVRVTTCRSRVRSPTNGPTTIARSPWRSYLSLGTWRTRPNIRGGVLYSWRRCYSGEGCMGNRRAMWAPAVGGSRHGRFRTIVKFECERFGGVSCECGDKSCRRTDKERIIENFTGCIHEWRVSGLFNWACLETFIYSRKLENRRSTELHDYWTRRR